MSWVRPVIHKVLFGEMSGGGTPAGSRAPVHTFEHFLGTNAALQRRVFGLANNGEQQ